MKRIKLFESFQDINPIELRDDIQSILYNIDDLGYDMKFEFRAKGSINFVMTCNQLDSFRGRIACFIIGLKLPSDIEGDFKYHYTELRKKLEWFLVLLKDHLDYIDPENIYIQDGATGASIIVKI